MPSPRPPAARTAERELSTTLMLTAIFGTFLAGCVLWAGGIVACWITGQRLPHAAAISGLRTLAHPGNPSLGWRTPMPSAIVYWTVTGCLIVAVVAAVTAVSLWWRRDSRTRHTDLRTTPGLATRAQVRGSASERALNRRAAILRPAVPKPRPNDLGYRLGTSNGLSAWTSIEDSLVILGPPRSGKGLHLVIPMILDSPGAVITTSTRADNLAATLDARRSNGGPLAVFDPQGLAPVHTSTINWSPVRGCADPQTAMVRARALAAGTSEHVENRGFWQAQTESALRAFLHAAALDNRDAGELYRWSLDPAAAGDAVRILNASPSAAPGWAQALEAIIHGDPRTRDNSWAGIRIALSCLADPRVLAAVSPVGDKHFDPQEFLERNGTLYLLGTASGVNAAAPLISALVEDVIDVARRIAGAARSTRLDPPLALILDEAANYPLPSLPSLISEGGGTGITTVAVLQSLAQARARWGEHDGAAIWDAASVKVILGGGSNARDLADIAALIGERDEQTESWTRDNHGARTISSSTRRIPILETGSLRTLPFGVGVLLLRTAPPILLDLDPWTARTRRRRSLGSDPSESAPACQTERV